jgi:hypothetical protein
MGFDAEGVRDGGGLPVIAASLDFDLDDAVASDPVAVQLSVPTVPRPLEDARMALIQHKRNVKKVGLAVTGDIDTRRSWLGVPLCKGRVSRRKSALHVIGQEMEKCLNGLCGSGSLFVDNGNPQDATHRMTEGMRIWVNDDLLSVAGYVDSPQAQAWRAHN